MGCDSSVGIATRYGLNGAGSNLPIPAAERSQARVGLQDNDDKETSAHVVPESTKNPDGDEIFHTLPDRPWSPPTMGTGSISSE